MLLLLGQFLMQERWETPVDGFPSLAALIVTHDWFARVRSIAAYSARRRAGDFEGEHARVVHAQAQGLEPGSLSPFFFDTWLMKMVSSEHWLML